MTRRSAGHHLDGKPAELRQVVTPAATGNPGAKSSASCGSMPATWTASASTARATEQHAANLSANKDGNRYQDGNRAELRRLDRLGAEQPQEGARQRIEQHADTSSAPTSTAANLRATRMAPATSCRRRVPASPSSRRRPFDRQAAARHLDPVEQQPR